MAFSYEVKRVVKERAGGFCSEFSNRRDRPTEDMHLFHGKTTDLNVASNCIRVLDIEHLAYHLYFYDKPGNIGLTKSQNIWAIKQIAARVTQFSYAKGLLGQYDEDVSSCLNGWAMYFGDA